MPFRHFIIKTIVLILLFPVLASAQQLRDFDITPVQSSRIPVFTQHPDKAAVIINSSLTNLRFESNLEIIAILGNPSQGEYILIINPVRQTITVSANGFQQGRVPITLNQARQVAHFKIEPKDRIITERGDLVVRTEPAGAMVSVEGIPGEFPTPYTFENLLAVTHSIRIRLDDYQTEERLVRVEPNRPAFESIQLIPSFGFLQLNEPDLDLFLTTPGDPQEFRVSYTRRQPLRRPIGLYTYRITKRHYRPSIDTVTVFPGRVSEMKPRFQPDYATYRFAAMPRGEVRVQAETQNAPVATKPNEINLQPGVHQITLSAPGYISEQIQIAARAGHVRDTVVALTGAGSLSISTDMARSIVTLSTGQSSASPARFNNLRPGRYTVIVTAAFHAIDSLYFDVASFQDINQRISLRPLYSTLTIRSNAPAIRLSANDNRAPISPGGGTIFLEQGQREVLVEADGYVTRRLFIRSVAGVRSDTSVTLLTNAEASELSRQEALPKGILRLSADVDADIYVNGRKEGQLQTSLTLVPGTYTVEFRHPLKNRRFRVDVPSADLVVRQVKLRPSKSIAIFSAMVIPGGGHLYTKRFRGYGYLGAVAGGLAYAWIQNGVADDKTIALDASLQLYRSARTLADATAYRQQAEQARMDVNRATSQLRLGLIAAASLYTLQLLDVGLTRPKYGYRNSEPRLELGLLPTGLQLTYRMP